MWIRQKVLKVNFQRKRSEGTVLLVLLLLLLSCTAFAEGAQEATMTGFKGFRTRSSQMKITDNALVVSNVAFAEANTGSLLWEDFDLSFKVTIGQLGSPYAGFTLIFRSWGGRDCYALTVAPDRTAVERFHGVYSDSRVLGYVARGMRDGETADYRITAQGNRFTVYKNGEKIIEAVDPDNMYPYGYMAVRAELASLTFADWTLKVSEIRDPVLRKRAEAGYGLPVEPLGGEMLKVQEGDPQNIMLVYDQYTHKNWMTVDALPYVAYLSAETYMPQDWFFDSFLFLALSAPGGRNFGGGNPAILEDFYWWLDRMFGKEKFGLGAFETAIANAKNVLGDPDHKAKVIMMIPHPSEIEGTPFGEINGERPVLRGNPTEAAKGRLKVAKWWIDEVVKRFNDKGYQNLELVGFYWLAEDLDLGGIDKLYLPDVGDYVRSLGMKFYWIPWYMSPGYDSWKELGFDYSIMQPNYMFDKDIAKTRLEKTAVLAAEANCGIEIEADDSVWTPSGKDRYLDYLRAANTHGWAGDVIKAFYQEVDLFGKAAMSSYPPDREIYDITYGFVKGTWTEKLKFEEEN